jgi:hypothetical protein
MSEYAMQHRSVPWLCRELPASPDPESRREQVLVSQWNALGNVEAR